MAKKQGLNLKKPALNETYLKKVRKKLDTNPTLFDLLEFSGFSTKDPKLLLELVSSRMISVGHVWECVLSHFMKFTKQLLLNSTAMDYADGTDAKFATANPPHTHYATVGGYENKTGTLRVCVCSPNDNYRLHFLLIPYEVYSKWKSPLKLSFTSKGIPTGEAWNNYAQYYRTFSEVCGDLSITQN